MHRRIGDEIGTQPGTCSSTHELTQTSSKVTSMAGDVVSGWQGHTRKGLKATPNIMEPWYSSRLWSRPGTVVRACQHVARPPSQLDQVFGTSQDWMDRLIGDTHAVTAVTRVRLQRPTRDKGVPTDDYR